MDKVDSRCSGIPSSRPETNCCASNDGKLSVHSKHRGAAERQKLDEQLNSQMKLIREKEASLKERLNDGDVLQSRLKDIRQEKEATINRRKVIDDDLKALNNEKTGETFIKLRGSLQYRSEKALNEAISRLELQLSTHNYRVSEEKKIVQEIDRLKRSKKTLKEYLSLEEELNSMKTNQRMMRTQRDGLYRQVTLLKVDEDELKKSSLENRNQIDQLKKDLDELHAHKRKTMSDLKQATQPMLHLRELQQKRPQNLKRREGCNFAQQHSFKDSRCSPQDSFVPYRKDRNECKSQDVSLEKEMLCNTLISYLRLISPAAVTPNTPVVESQAETPVAEIQDGDKVLVLRKRCDEDDAFTGQKVGRTLKKGKKERKRTQQNRLLSHTPDMLDQFYKLGISPPSSLNDVASCLEALAAKKHQLQFKKENVMTEAEQPTTEESGPAETERSVKGNTEQDVIFDLAQKTDELDSMGDRAPCSDENVFPFPVRSGTGNSDCDMRTRNDSTNASELVVQLELTEVVEENIGSGLCANRKMPKFSSSSAVNGELTDSRYADQNCRSQTVPAFGETFVPENFGNSPVPENSAEGDLDESEECTYADNSDSNIVLVGAAAEQNCSFIISTYNHSDCQVCWDGETKPPEAFKVTLPANCEVEGRLANGVCNGDVPISSHLCNEIQRDDNLICSQGSDNSIAYSI